MAVTRLTPLVCALTLLSSSALPRSAHAQGAADVVLEWNRILITAIGIPGAHPPTVFPTRPYAMVNVAIFDALNAIDRQYAPYVYFDAAPEGASADAAAAQAAHDVLVAVLPTERARFDDALAATLADLEPGAAAAGAAVGAAAARATIERRASDGWDRPNADYLLPSLPGYWQPTPPANAVAGFVHYQDVDGFIVGGNARALMVEAPPALTSTRYAADFNEVKAIGSASSTTRTEEQTQVAQLWAGVGTSTTLFAVWNGVMQDLARTRELSAVDTARMFALATMAAHDALLVSFNGKFRYGLWRPVTAIREAARDGNDATEADPEWLPLIPTPPYPSYPGNMACIAASQARVLERVMGRDDIPVSITWTGTAGPDVMRTYNGFREIADEEARSREYAGIHFRFDTLASFGVCTVLADYAVDHFLTRRP